MTSSRHWVLQVKRRVAMRSLLQANRPLASCTDSKTLKDPEREDLFEVILDKKDNVKFAVTVMSPHDISNGMLRRIPYDL